MSDLKRGDWLWVDRLFEAAQDLPETEREPFVRASEAPANIGEEGGSPRGG